LEDGSDIPGIIWTITVSPVDPNLNSSTPGAAAVPAVELPTVNNAASEDESPSSALVLQDSWDDGQTGLIATDLLPELVSPASAKECPLVIEAQVVCPTLPTAGLPTEAPETKTVVPSADACPRTLGAYLDRVRRDYQTSLVTSVEPAVDLHALGRVLDAFRVTNVSTAR
jgi:hypothetical protein